MTSITTANTLNQQLYMRLFDSLNANGDDALSVDEIGAASAQDADSSANVFKALDTDSDGRVIRSEMTPSSTFGADTLGSLIAAQSGADGDEAKSDSEVVADLFARADLDGDGALNAEEMAAESDLRRATNLDAGYSAGPVFMPKDKDGNGLLTSDEVGVVRQLQTLALPISSIRFFDEMPEEQQQVMQAARERMGLPPLKPLTDEEKTAQRAQWAADRAERESGPEGTRTFLSREIEGLRTKASTAYAAGDLSKSLTQRLLQQILGEAWKTEASA